MEEAVKLFDKKAIEDPWGINDVFNIKTES